MTEPQMFTAYEMGLESLTPTISAYYFDNGNAEVEWYEDTVSHRERHPYLFDEDGWLTDAAQYALEDIARERYGAAEISLNGGDEPHVMLVWDMVVGSHADAPHVGAHAWNTLAQVANETDPGTFGSPYLFDLVAREMEER